MLSVFDGLVIFLKFQFGIKKTVFVHIFLVFNFLLV